VRLKMDGKSKYWVSLFWICPANWENGIILYGVVCVCISEKRGPPALSIHPSPETPSAFENVGVVCIKTML
jgi:hypothetical protein